MNIFQRLWERLFRPELPVRQDVIDNDERLRESNLLRQSWLLSITYLCEGDLDALEKHPDFDARKQGISYIHAYYAVPQGKKGPCRRVVVRFPAEGVDEIEARYQLEKALKLDLHSRGCNAGVFYKRYKRGNSMYAEAVPATLTGE